MYNYYTLKKSNVKNWFHFHGNDDKHNKFDNGKMSHPWIFMVIVKKKLIDNWRGCKKCIDFHGDNNITLKLTMEGG